MKYFSMFTGVGGFELGIGDKGQCVGFSELDKYSSELLANKFPGIKNYGDATKIIPEQIQDFDLLVGGFPCQAFSIAGRRKGFEDTRGTLFYDIARIVKVKRPKYILLENVKGLLSHDGGKTFGTILTTFSELGYVIQWMVLNSKFFGVPQNRERVFIVGSLREEPIPEILPLGEINETDNELQGQQTNTLKARYNAIGDGSYIIKSKFNAQDPRMNQLNSNVPDSQRVFDTEGVSVTLKGLGGGQGAKTGLYLTSATKQGYSEAEVGDGVRLEYPESKTARGRVIKQNANTLKSGSEGVVVMDLYNNKEHSDRSPALTEPHHNTLRVREGLRIRRLTPTECERLQGFPDGWTKGFSDTQRYKMMGNAVTVNVVKVVIGKIFEKMRQPEIEPQRRVD